ncbi:MAG: hypothetical protein AAGA23_18155 [Pseudomonadota bacterium]
MSAMIRKDLSQVLITWIMLSSLIWLATPWGSWLTDRVGSAWLWCGLIPLSLLLAVQPRAAAASLAWALRLALRSAGMFCLLLAGELPPNDGRHRRRIRAQAR